MSHSRPYVTLLLAAALALGVLGPASARTHAMPKYGGTLVFGLAGDADSLDPTLSTGGASIAFYRVTCQRLYEYDSKLQTAPVLAAELPALSKDKLSYTIQLREGVRFNDGTPFNAQAIVTNYRHYVIDNPDSTRASDFASVASVTASGPYTVVYRLKARDSTFTGNMYVLSPTQLAKLGGDFGADPVCVGPFMFDDRVVGDHITVIKSPHYYDQKNVYLDKIVYKVLPNAAAAAAALRAGDIQVLDVSPAELPAIESDPSLRVLPSPQVGWQGISINIGNKNGVEQPHSNVGTPLASSAKLRQAFEEAIDRDALNRVVFDGRFQPSCTMIAPTNAAWYDATKVPCTPYNLKHAKKLVAESGFPNPTVRLLVPNDPDNLRLAQFIQAAEAKVGIIVVIESVDVVTAMNRRTSGAFDITRSGMSPGVPEPNDMIYRFVGSSSKRNWAGYSSPRLDLILSNGLKATSTRARSTLYRVAQQILQNDRPLIVLWNSVTLAAFSKDVAGVQVNALGAVIVANARFK